MIILNMIVKNEAHCISKCLDSVVGFVDKVVIVDTGSTDDTQNVVGAWMLNTDLDGGLYERSWVNFGHNRNEALELAKSKAAPGDYIFFIDADEHIRNKPASLRSLDHDGYYLNVSYGNLSYARVALVNAKRPFKWHGSVHEYIHMPNASMGRLESPEIVVEHTGARSKDPDTYKKDVEMLLAEHKRDPNDVRTVFYLAQSYRDAGELDKAIDFYEKRASMGGWFQEVFFSLYQVGLLEERLGAVDEARVAWLKAYNIDPTRAEPLVALARSHRIRGEHAVALVYAEWASKLGHPGPDGLFVNQNVYSYEALDEVAVSAFYVPSKSHLGRDAAQKLVAMRPDDQRMKDNLQHYMVKRGPT